MKYLAWLYFIVGVVFFLTIWFMF